MKVVPFLAMFAATAISLSGIACSAGRSPTTALRSKSKTQFGTRSSAHLDLIARGYRLADDPTLVSARTSTDASTNEEAPDVGSEPIIEVKADEPGFSYWDVEAAPAAADLAVRIDLSEQAAHFYRGDKKVGQSRVSTGKPGRETPTGTFSVLEKRETKRSNLYGRLVDEHGVVILEDADARNSAIPENCRFVGARMPYWLRLTYSGVGMHAGIIPEPGTASSHGCIRLPMEFAEKLYRNAEVGTQVTVVP